MVHIRTVFTVVRVLSKSPLGTLRECHHARSVLGYISARRVGTIESTAASRRPISDRIQVVNVAASGP